MKTYKITFSNGLVDLINSNDIVEAIHDALQRNNGYSLDEIIEAREV